MGFFIIQRIPDGAMVALPGSEHSYTCDVFKARRFNTREDAQRECCGNERVINLFEVILSR